VDDKQDVPMIESKCFDRGWHDYGHVHGDPDGWGPVMPPYQLWSDRVN
jgi:hypothetical protein